MGRRNRKFTLFTPGPVMMEESLQTIGASALPYFRTKEFSARMFRAERLLLKLLEAPSGYRVVVLTGSGTAAMESVIASTFGPDDSLLILEGGGFGERFAEICQFHSLPHESLQVAPGKNLERGALDRYRRRNFRALFVNHHETTTGQLFPLEPLKQFCREENQLLIVDAISSFLADPVTLKNGDIDALILSSQKGFALPPGLSFLVLSPRMIDRINRHKGSCYYLDLKRYLKDGERGQPPFTPAIGILMQWEAALLELTKTGIASRIQAVERLAKDFRKRIDRLPFTVFAQTPSNAVTALSPTDGRSALWYVERLREEYGYFVCPNGGTLQDKIFRVGHLGALTKADNTRLISALKTLSQLKTDRRLAA